VAVVAIVRARSDHDIGPEMVDETTDRAGELAPRQLEVVAAGERQRRVVHDELDVGTAARLDELRTPPVVLLGPPQRRREVHDAVPGAAQREERRGRRDRLVVRMRRHVQDGRHGIDRTAAGPLSPNRYVAVAPAGSQPIEGAMCRAIVSSICALYSTPSWLGTVSRTVSASRTAASRLSSSAMTSGSPV
jgi:hypothetical protein